jgi:hypothetical protein
MKGGLSLSITPDNPRRYGVIRVEDEVEVWLNTNKVNKI